MDSIDKLFNSDRRKLAEVYNTKKKRNNRFIFVIEVLFWVIFLGFSLEKKSFNYFSKMLPNNELKTIVYLFSFYLLYSIFTSVVNYFLGYKLERQYKLSNQDIKDWLADESKSFILGLIFFYLAVRTYLYFLVIFPDNWWIYYFILASLFTVLVTFIFPIILLPIFFKLEKYPESELKDYLLNLIKKADLPIDDIYEINLSSKINAANAAVMGLGNSRKIVLSDNLKDIYSIDEIEAILAHELGHQVHGDIFKGLLIEPIRFLITACIIANIWPKISLWFAYSSTSNLASIPLLMLIVSVLLWLFSPLQLFISRRFEKRADHYAVKLTDKVDSFTRALAKLADESLAPLRVTFYEKIFKLSHPPIKDRVRYLMENK